jgi:DNA-binding NarL/FixJ family response regulator
MSPSCSTQPAGIIVADALPLFRCGLLNVLAQSFARYPLYEAATAAEVVKLASSLGPELVIIAASLLDTSAGALVTALRERHPHLAVVVLIDPATTPELMALRLLRQNVNSLLLCAASPEEVCETISAVFKRGRYYNDYTLGLLQSQMHHRSLAQAADIFSPRQLEVLQLIARDHSNEDIAEYLCTSVRTVEYHRSQMLQKAGARTTLGLVLFAQRKGLLTADMQPEPAQAACYS